MAKTLEERMQIADRILSRGMSMARPLKADSLKNKVFGDSCTGYTFELGTLSYRGIWVSTIEDIELKVDGEVVPKCDMLFYVNGMCFPIDDMVSHTEVFWGVLDKGVVNVNKIGGLSKGEHKFEIVIKKRADFGHSYGEGLEGYENATEFHNPAVIRDEITYTV